MAAANSIDPTVFIIISLTREARNPTPSNKQIPAGFTSTISGQSL